jgi:transglutaminase-like putative cysteine protease
MKSLLSVIFILSITTFRGYSQTYENQPFDNSIAHDFAWGDYDHAAFDMDHYATDPSAHALVLKEFGKAWITSNGNNNSLIFEYHVKIKIFDSKAFDKGHVKVPYYIQDNGSYEEIRAASVAGMTYYRTANGAMQSTDLNPDSISIVKINKHWSEIVFNLPHLSEGCIIEYKYRLESPFLDKFKTWQFQSDIPKVYSEYEVHIPNVFGYNITLRGPLKLSKDTVSIEKNCYESTNLKSDCRVEDYKMEDVPALKFENDMPPPANYLSALYFQITQSTQLNNFVNLDQAFQQDVAENWSDADKTLKYDDNFGSQLNRKSFFKDKLGAITTGKTDTLEKAKAIYAYIQKNIVFDGENTIYADNGIKKALEKHTGNVADINLALTDAMNEAGIPASAVIISTRDNGMLNNLYPALTEFNYVTAVMINKKVYLLDATDPLLPFGILPLKDLNNRGRVFPVNGPSYWIKLVTSQQKITAATIDLTLSTDGKLTGSVTNYSKGYAAYEKHIEAGKYNPAAGLTLPGITIKTYSTGGSGPSFVQVYNVQVDNQDKTNTGNFTFKPFMLGKPANGTFCLLDTLTADPFAAAVRNYPVDFIMPSAYSVSLTLHLPPGYKIASSPQDINAPDENGLSMSATFIDNGATVNYTLTYNLDKPVYDTAEYANLKALFEKIISAESAAISIIKK